MLSTDNKELQFKSKILEGIKAWKKGAQETVKLKKMKSERNDELENIKTVALTSRSNVEKVLNKHLQDRILQPLEKFKNSAEKEVGVTEGYQAKYQYDDKQDDKQTAAFMIKSFINKTLVYREQQSCLSRFKKSFYRASERNMRLFPQGFLFKFDAIRKQIIDVLWANVEQNICYDDLNIADFVREYFAGDLYRLLLQDKAPLIELVTNQTLPAKRFVKEESGDKCEFKDQYIELLHQEKNQPKLFLRSKFLHNFTTLTDLKANGKKYKDAEGFEKILAAQMLLGEADIVQAENFGLIEKDGGKAFAKIDHGRSLYLCAKSWEQTLLYDFSLFYGIKVDYGILSSELGNFTRFISDNEELIYRLIDKRANDLNSVLNPAVKFTLRYVSSNAPPTFYTEVFSCHSESKEFISDEGNNLNTYFKQRLQNQIKVMREYSEILCVLAAISNNFGTIAKLLPAFYSSQYKDPLIWAIETDKKLDGKNPLAWAIENNKQIEGGDAVKWAKDHHMIIGGRDPETFAHIIRDKNLSKYLKVGAQLKKTAVALFIGVLAELATVTTIYCKGIEIGMTAQQQSLTLKLQ